LRPDEAQQLAADHHLAVYSFPERSKGAELFLNLDAGPLRDVGVRRALAWLVDRGALVDGPLDGQGEPAFSPIPVQSWAFAPGLGVETHDAVAAAALLDAAGWAIGPDGIRQHEATPL